MDVPDTDLEAALYEILPDGGSVYLTGATMRARYRESLREAKPVPAGKAEKYDFDNFTFFSRRIAKGSRLRLLVHCLNSICTREELQQRRRRGERDGQGRADGARDAAPRRRAPERPRAADRRAVGAAQAISAAAVSGPSGLSASGTGRPRRDSRPRAPGARRRPAAATLSIAWRKSAGSTGEAPARPARAAPRAGGSPPPSRCRDAPRPPPRSTPPRAPTPIDPPTVRKNGTRLVATPRCALRRDVLDREHLGEGARPEPRAHDRARGADPGDARVGERARDEARETDQDQRRLRSAPCGGTRSRRISRPAGGGGRRPEEDQRRHDGARGAGGSAARPLHEERHERVHAEDRRAEEDPGEVGGRRLPVAEELRRHERMLAARLRAERRPRGERRPRPAARRGRPSTLRPARASRRTAKRTSETPSGERRGPGHVHGIGQRGARFDHAASRRGRTRSAPRGMLIEKMDRHPKCTVRNAPSSGPTRRGEAPDAREEPLDARALLERVEVGRRPSARRGSVPRRRVPGSRARRSAAASTGRTRRSTAPVRKTPIATRISRRRP